jgi:hypothetical protein
MNINHKLKDTKFFSEFSDVSTPGDTINSKGRIEVKL